MKNVSRVYPFTNENLSSYQELYDFQDSRVLSVLGSGDQYFSSLLYGAKEVDLFDINLLANYYFALKFYSIKVLSYQEFIDFFVSNKLDNNDIYNKVRPYLPEEIKGFFDHVLICGRSLSSLIFSTSMNNHPINYSTSRVVPYFDESKYNELKYILNHVNFPKIFNISLEHLHEVLIGEYDVMLFSNIYLYMMLGVEEYKDFLENYIRHLKDGGSIQANYCWSKNELDSSFLENGFELTEVPSIRYGVDLEYSNDYVLSLKKS